MAKEEGVRAVVVEGIIIKKTVTSSDVLTSVRTGWPVSRLVYYKQGVH